MTFDCSFCVQDVDDAIIPDCEDCKLPEFSQDGECYRDTCDVCGTFIMIPMSAHDHFNLVICKKCAKDTSDPLGFDLKGIAYGDCESVYVEGTRKWW